jgi:hypothetical protein
VGCAGSLEEEEEWRRNLEVYNISTVANGFIFLRRGGGHKFGADLPGENLNSSTKRGGGHKFGADLPGENLDSSTKP